MTADLDEPRRRGCDRQVRLDLCRELSYPSTSAGAIYWLNRSRNSRNHLIADRRSFDLASKLSVPSSKRLRRSENAVSSSAIVWNRSEGFFDCLKHFVRLLDAEPGEVWFWASKEHEIDFVDSERRLYEVTVGQTGLVDFAWFPKVFPKRKLAGHWRE
ncbi:MAG TPA: hypothetical protein VLK65_03155 [Vicinamibacteria bacterium]|nr:hypothetical protein [Vicinamibacteria bacterium]